VPGIIGYQVTVLLHQQNLRSHHDGAANSLLHCEILVASATVINRKAQP
jgi:hypothetical protein